MTLRTNRKIVRVISGMETSDGAGVKLTRVIGSPQLNMLDPFLLLDCFESDDADDYIAGFPTHPHRGFETVTYLLNGKMRHKDSAGHEGVIEPGGVQWMTAGRGILHSEMPEQEEGLLKGFQLWVNLPASAKMTAPRYQEYKPESMPVEKRADGVEVRVISGETDEGAIGPVENDYISPTYLDVTVPEGLSFKQAINAQHNAFVYVVEGEVFAESEEANSEPVLQEKMLGVFGQGDGVELKSINGASRFLLIAGKPLNEPVARGGPFVMNTREEIMQAFEDYQAGNLV